VIGLDVALLLAERGYGSHITVVAEHLPGDTSTNYTSPWLVDIFVIRDPKLSDRLLTFNNRAGANFSAISGDDANALRWDKLGYSQMMKLAEERGIEAYIAKTPSFEYWDEMPSRAKIDSMAEYLRDVSTILIQTHPSNPFNVVNEKD
jgi:D-amino-acid oxidase